MKKYNYYFLHGFLGSSDDFLTAMNHFRKQSETNSMQALSLFSPEIDSQLSPINDFTEWAKNFNKSVIDHGHENQQNIFVGYSMGGRLGIHAYFDNKDLWHKCYFLSSNPGLIKENEKIKRWMWEDQWKDLLLNGEWSDFIDQWNQQDVFKGSKEAKPKEEEFNKDHLASAIKNWSLTRHSIPLKELNDKKLNWLIGSKDEKYISLFEQLSADYKLVNVIEVNCGHRIYQTDFHKFIV